MNIRCFFPAILFLTLCSFCPAHADVKSKGLFPDPVTLQRDTKMPVWGTATSGVSDQVDWPAFMERQDPVWHRVPARWMESPFLGNGWMGTMIYQNNKNPHELRIDVQHAAVTDHNPAGGAPMGLGRVMIGYFAVATAGEIQDCDLRLDLWNAELKGTLRTTKGTIALRAFVHTEDMVAQVEVSGDGGEAPKIEFRPGEAVSPRYLFKKKDKNFVPPVGYDPASHPNPQPDLLARDGMNVCRQSLNSGGEFATAWTLATKETTSVLRFTVTQSFPETNAIAEAVANLKNAAAIPAAKWEATHRNWWHEIYQRSFVSMTDPYWESFYWMQRYKMAAATRADRCVIDNHGPWLEPTIWPYATWNLNVQLSYWAFNPAGLGDLAASLPNHLKQYATNLINNVAPAYRADSAGIGTSSTEFLVGGIGQPGKGAEVGNLTWIMHDVWLQYRHSMDESLLRDPMFPMLRRCINYYRHFLATGEDGRLHLPKTGSPEYGQSAADCNYDLSLIRWGCQTLLWINDRLQLNDPLAPEWKNILEKLTPYPGNNTDGFFIYGDVPYAMSHRHFSHLLMIYPLYLVNAEQPGGREQIERCIAHWHSMPKELAGYSFTGSASMYAGLGDGDRALEKLNGLRSRIDPNTMYHEAYGSPCIETPLAAAQSVHDMLLQSWGETIRVFPALPTTWTNAVFRDLRTEGAFSVSAASANGKTEWVSVKSLAGEPFRIRPGIAGKIQITGSGTAHLKETVPGTYALTLAKGEEVLFASNRGSLFTIRPVADSEPHRFGLP